MNILSEFDDSFTRQNLGCINSIVGPFQESWHGVDNKLIIKRAETMGDFFHAHKLLQTYAEIMDVDLELDGFSAELQRLPTAYCLPHGTLLLANKGNDYIGCVGWRRSTTLIAEVKRMFVLPEYSGHGIGRIMLEKLIESVRQHGFSTLRLEVLHFSKAAIALYRKMGFEEIEHYRQAPLGDTDYLSMQLNLLNA